MQAPSGHPIIRRFLGVPFVFNGEVAGIVAAANKDIDYTEFDKTMLEDLTPTIIRAMQKKRAETALQQSEQRSLELIDRLSAANKSQNDFSMYYRMSSEIPLLRLLQDCTFWMLHRMPHKWKKRK
jgi:GAF domain-containing protein